MRKIAQIAGIALGLFISIPSWANSSKNPQQPGSSTSKKSETSQPINQVLAPGKQTSATTFEADPIDIMAQPPEEEYKDEFQLPSWASAKLKAARNQIDQETAKLEQIAKAIEELMDKSSFDSTVAEIKLLKKAQKMYQAQLRIVENSQNKFREQFVTDEDNIYADLAEGPQVTNTELNQND